MTEITPENLISAGYKGYANRGSVFYYDTLYLKIVKEYDSITKTQKIKYILNVYLYIIEDKNIKWNRYETNICVDTDTGGYAWITIEEKDIETFEKRAEMLWSACGKVSYGHGD
jgi:hypothetical protein